MKNLRSLSFSRSTENKDHSPSSHQEPSPKQKGGLDILPSFVIKVIPL